MKKRTKIVAGAGAMLAIAGGGAAVAADQLSPKAESQAVLNDAAKQLGVTPAKLSAALEQALKNRVDEAVESGKLTQAQADAMKQRIDAGEFPLFAGPGMRGHHGERGFFRHGGGHLDAAAAYLGLTEAELRSALADGASLADVAKEEGKSVDGLVDAIVADEKAELDEAVQDGRLTDAQRDRIEATMEERVQDFVEGVRPPFGMRGPGHHGFRGMPGMPPMEDRGGDA
jgi:hypothetical protein